MGKDNTGMRIDLFVPEITERRPLNIDKLNEKTGKQFVYASKGRYSLLHILRGLKSDRKVLLCPAYFCPTVLETVDQLKLDMLFYDLDYDDLNPDAASIEMLLKEKCNEVRAVLVPSFYGNPADLGKIESVCAAYRVPMIDDAAQSFGAILDQRFVGTFGDAGFFSFSPGKATAGHMGSFFWSGYKVSINRRHHLLGHLIQYWDFHLNRLNAYKSSSTIKRATGFLSAASFKIFDYKDDDIEGFELPLFGGYLWDNLQYAPQRRVIHSRFAGQFESCGAFRVIRTKRGMSHPCKIVLLFRDTEKCGEFKMFLQKKEICFFGGYDYMRGYSGGLDATEKIVGHIVELPIELDEGHMEYMFDMVKEYVEETQ